MPDEKQETPTPTPTQPQFEISEPEDGIIRIYSNIAHLTWTGMDVTVQLYEFMQPNRDFPQYANDPTEILHTANVTMAWSAAKIFHKTLGDVLERYEKVYGSIKTEFQNI